MLFWLPYTIPSDKTQMVAYLICPSVQEVDGLADLFSLPGLPAFRQALNPAGSGQAGELVIPNPVSH
jgi:hypothetical protein